jgi:hypothetical protein
MIVLANGCEHTAGAGCAATKFLYVVKDFPRCRRPFAAVVVTKNYRP